MRNAKDTLQTDVHAKQDDMANNLTKTKMGTTVDAGPMDATSNMHSA